VRRRGNRLVGDRARQSRSRDPSPRTDRDLSAPGWRGRRLLSADLVIRRAEESDFDGIWEIFHAVVAKGDTYAYDPETTKEQARALWMAPGLSTYVALLEDEV